MITSFVDMEATQVPPQQPNPNIQATVRSILCFLQKTSKTTHISNIKKNLEDETFRRDDPMFLLYFIYIALLDKNLVRSKKENIFAKLITRLVYGGFPIEHWEIILLNFLEKTPRESAFPWTDEEKEVWKLVLFFLSEQFGKNSCEKFCFMLCDKTRRMELSPRIHKLGLKPFKETQISQPENPSAKMHQTVECQTVDCQICGFHGDPEIPSKMCQCCVKCHKRNEECIRCRICNQHDSKKCGCCQICNTSAEGCQKCPECNEHKCSC